MALNAEQLLQIAGLVAQSASLRDAAAAVRGALPGLRAIVVDALDVSGEAPAFCVGARQVHLIHTDGHCWQLTREPGRADGLLLAEA